jgi:hypothetical protein
MKAGVIAISPISLEFAQFLFLSTVRRFWEKVDGRNSMSTVRPLEKPEPIGARCILKLPGDLKMKIQAHRFARPRRDEPFECRV